MSREITKAICSKFSYDVDKMHIVVFNFAMEECSIQYVYNDLYFAQHNKIRAVVLTEDSNEKAFIFGMHSTPQLI